MPFQPNDPNINRSGKPAGAKTSLKIPVNSQRAVIRQLTERAKQGDKDAVDTLALIMIKSGVG